VPSLALSLAVRLATRRTGARAGSESVGRLARVDLVDPSRDTAADVDGVGVARALEHGQALGRADPGLAVQHDLLVLGQLLEGLAGEDLALGDEHGAGNPVDLVLVRLAHVDEDEVPRALLALLEPSVERRDRDRRVGGRLGGVLAEGAAEGLV